jgi:hypothetical protein
MNIRKEDRVRISVSRDELLADYELLGAEVGRLQARAEIRNLRISDIAPELQPIRERMSRIAEAIEKLDVVTTRTNGNQPA